MLHVTKEVRCRIHGSFDSLIVQLLPRGVVMAGVSYPGKKLVGWITIASPHVTGQVVDIDCREGDTEEPVLIVTTADGSYLVTGYMEAGHQRWEPYEVPTPDSTPTTATL